MHDEVEMLRRLRVDDLPLSTVDLNRAMRAGRRRERIAAVTVGGLAAVLVLATVVAVAAVAGKDGSAPRPSGSRDGSRSPQPAPPLGSCTVGKAPVDFSQRTNVMTDRAGQVFITQKLDEFNTVLRWKDGRQERIDGIPAGGGSAKVVNSSGTFAGGSGYKTPWVYRDGAFTVLPSPPDVSAMSVEGINDRGDLIGEAFYSAGGRYDIHAVLWPAHRQETPVLLDTPAGWSSRVSDIADDGTVVGYLSHRTEGKDHDVVPMAWGPDGSARRLPVPAAWVPDAEGPTARAITGDWVVGNNLRWNLQTGTAEVVEGLEPTKVDKYGRLFGLLPIPHGDSSIGRPAVWVNGDVQPLPTYPDHPAASLLSVSLDGQRITGYSVNLANLDKSATIWTCGR